MLNKAKETALKENLKVDFRTGDARELKFLNKFDLAIMLCEGAFTLMETDEMNFRILECAARALKQNSKLIFTTLNGLFPLFHSDKDFLASKTEEGNATYRGNLLDFKTIDIFGERLCAFGRDIKLTTENFEMLVIASK